MLTILFPQSECNALSDCALRLYMAMTCEKWSLYYAKLALFFHICKHSTRKTQNSSCYSLRIESTSKCMVLRLLVDSIFISCHRDGYRGMYNEQPSYCPGDFYNLIFFLTGSPSLLSLLRAVTTKRYFVFPLLYGSLNHVSDVMPIMCLGSSMFISSSILYW